MDYHKSIYRLSPREDKSITKIKLVSGNEFIFSDIYKTLSYYKNKIDDCKKIGTRLKRKLISMNWLISLEQIISKMMLK